MKYPGRRPFDISKYPWKGDIDYRKHPEKYLVGKGEQGVLLCEPYKSEILPYWKFKTPEIARDSSEKIFNLFHKYVKEKDFIGADMARKFLQMGFTRSRRYANYKGGKKYKEEGGTFVKGSGDPQKNESASIFFAKWKEAEACDEYKTWKDDWKSTHG